MSDLLGRLNPTAPPILEGILREDQHRDGQARRQRNRKNAHQDEDQDAPSTDEDVSLPPHRIDVRV